MSGIMMKSVGYKEISEDYVYVVLNEFLSLTSSRYHLDIVYEWGFIFIQTIELYLTCLIARTMEIFIGKSAV